MVTRALGRVSLKGPSLSGHLAGIVPVKLHVVDDRLPGFGFRALGFASLFPSLAVGIGPILATRFAGLAHNLAGRRGLVLFEGFGEDQRLQ